MYRIITPDDYRTARVVRRQHRFIAYFLTAAVAYVAALATLFLAFGSLIS